MAKDDRDCVREGKWGKMTWGSFPLDLDAHIGLGLFLLTVRFWWTSKNHKHANITKHMRNEIWSSHVIIQSVSTKNFPASFILSKYAKRKTRLCCLSDFVFFLLHEKELSFQSLILANKSLPVTRHIRKMFRHLNTKKLHWPHSNIWKATTQRKTLSIKQKVSLEILVLFWNSSHLSTPLNLSSRKSDKQWVMMVMHDFINHSWEGLVVKRHSPGGLECDSHMLTGFVLLKMKQKDISQIRIRLGYGWMR